MRHIVWFSCGIPSAVTAYLAVKEGLNPTVVYCDTMESENADNQRFFNDVQDWIGTPIFKIHSKEFKNIDEVFMKKRYMSGIAGAPCTTEMKKMPRFDFQQADDIHYFGYTLEEKLRMLRLRQNNPELDVRFILAYFGLTKEDCHKMIPMKPPIMYELGFNNNNCIGCVKAQSPKYWNLIRKNFPDVFEKRCKQSREIGARLVKIGKTRMFLDELAPDNMIDYKENIECGVICHND